MRDSEAPIAASAHASALAKFSGVALAANLKVISEESAQDPEKGWSSPHRAGNHHKGQFARFLALGEQAIEMKLVNECKESKI